MRERTRLCKFGSSHGLSMAACCNLEAILTNRMSSLKLHIYRSLGISATQDPTTGEFNRAVVRKSSMPDGPEEFNTSGRGDVNVINVDSKLNRGFYTSMFWDAL